MAGTVDFVTRRLQAAGYAGAKPERIGSRFTMTEEQLNGFRQETAVLMHESAAMKNYSVDRAARIATNYI
ncbi:hypothetical protein B5F74_10420 [Collinsella sp. An271]|uniref:hypothetical protein n=1 Tax=Collinsella sp. An271 TaxID=1965616 RepID=UPI000B3A6492|nr:hypothetical protein [Collinsella sp. An271]OUO58388.1 hypothetical protein B5F74_10420 [Collinsella sp. An271]